MKSTILSLAAVTALFIGCGTKTQDNTEEQTETPAETVPVEAHNVLTESEKADGWVLMYDGASSDGWRGYNSQEFPGSWTTDGTLYFSKSRKEEGDGNHDIIYGQEFSNFHFKVEWKVAEAGNSGIFYLGQEGDWGAIYYTAPEMQVLDNERHPDAKNGKDGNHKAGSLYDLIPADPTKVNPAGEWNAAEVIIKDGHVQHIMNGAVVVEYDLWTEEWETMVAGSKFPGLNENWSKVAKSGYIGLQDHDDDVWYRNIKIKEL